MMLMPYSLFQSLCDDDPAAGCSRDIADVVLFVLHDDDDEDNAAVVAIGRVANPQNAGWNASC